MPEKYIAVAGFAFFNPAVAAAADTGGYLKIIAAGVAGENAGGKAKVAALLRAGIEAIAQLAAACDAVATAAENHGPGTIGATIADAVIIQSIIAGFIAVAHAVATQWGLTDAALANTAGAVA